MDVNGMQISLFLPRHDKSAYPMVHYATIIIKHELPLMDHEFAINYAVATM